MSRLKGKKLKKNPLEGGFFDGENVFCGGDCHSSSTRFAMTGGGAWMPDHLPADAKAQLLQAGVRHDKILDCRTSKLAMTRSFVLTMYIRCGKILKWLKGLNGVRLKTKY